MDRFLLTLTRLSLSAWLGAAVLFVATGVAEVRSPEFESTTKNALAALRFPYYYLFGFTLVGAGLFGSWMLSLRGTLRLPGLKVLVGCMTVASILMNIDYLYVFRPLLVMMADEVKPQNFQSYHQMSMILNAIGLLFVFVSAVLACSVSPNQRPSVQSPM